MKKTLTSTFRRSLSRIALAAIAISASSGAALAVTAPGMSPAGTWDCVMSGARTGLAYLTFSSNFTFTATEVLVPKKPAPPSVPNPADNRGPDTDVGRNSGEVTGTTSSTSINGITNSSLFGFITNVNGTWTFDDQGRVFGYFAESLPGPCVTNFFVTNSPIGLVTNQEVDCSSQVTTTVSFTGKVSPDGKHLQLHCTTSLGNVTYRGVPAKQLLDFTGPFFGVKKGNGSPVINETFSLSLDTNSVNNPGSLPNFYDISGTGPGYGYIGFALLSSQSRMGFVSRATNSSGDLGNLRSVIGPFNLNTGKGNLSGWDQPEGPLNSHINFRVVKQ